jgi:hypothetical protein
MRLVKCAASFSVTFATLVACSDGDSTPTKQAYVAPDAAVYVPPADPTPPNNVTIIVKGDGAVIASDGSINCSQGATGAKCTSTHYGISVTGVGNIPWTFDHWEPSMETAATMRLESWTGSPLTAVFTPTPLFDGGDLGD